MPFGLLVWRVPGEDAADSVLEMANEQASRITDFDFSKYVEQSIATIPSIMEPGLDGVSPADRVLLAGRDNQASRSEASYNHPDGGQVHVISHHVPAGHGRAATFFVTSTTLGHLSALTQLSEEIGRARGDQQEVLRGVAERLRRDVADVCAIGLLDDARTGVTLGGLACSDAQVESDLLRWFSADEHKAVAGTVAEQVVATGNAGFYPTVSREEWAEFLRPEYLGLPVQGAHGLICVPLRWRDEVVGVIWLTRTVNQEAFTSDDYIYVQMVADRVASMVSADHTMGELEVQAAMLRTMAEGVWMLRADDGEVVWGNDAMGKLLGVDPLLLSGSSVLDHLGKLWADPHLVLAGIQRALDRSGAWHGELPLRTRAGRELICEVACSQWQHPRHGRVWIVSHADVTERRNAERQLADFFDMSTDLLAILDRSGRFIRWAERAWTRILGWTAADLSARRVHDFAEPDDIASIEELGDRLKAEGELQEFELRCRTKDGRLRWIQWSARYQRDEIHLVGRDVTDLKRFNERLLSLARTDGLTGLVNRGEFGDALDRAIEDARGRSGWLDLLYVDLDGFKEINDRQGHAVGDVVLKEVGHRLSAVCRSGDLSGRIGGDEFAVIVSNDSGEGSGEQVAERIRASLTEPIETDGLQFNVSASIGLASFPVDGESAAELLRRADAAMYAAKRDPFTSIRRFGPDCDVIVLPPENGTVNGSARAEGGSG